MALSLINEIRTRFRASFAGICGKEYSEGSAEALEHVEDEMEATEVTGWQAEKIALAQSLREQARQLMETARQLEAEVQIERVSKHTNSPKGSLHWLRTILGSTMDVLNFVPKYPNRAGNGEMCASHVAQLREVLEHYEKN